MNGFNHTDAWAGVATNYDQARRVTLAGLRRGLTITDAVRAAGVSRQTFYHWRETIPSFDEDAQEILDRREVEREIRRQEQRTDTYPVLDARGRQP